MVIFHGKIEFHNFLYCTKFFYQMKMNFFYDGITLVNRTSLCITICPAVHSTNNSNTGGAPGTTKPSHGAGVVAVQENEIVHAVDYDDDATNLVPR